MGSSLDTDPGNVFRHELILTLKGTLMKSSPPINLSAIEERNKVKNFRAMLPELKRPDLEDLCLCLLMEREYDGYNGRRGDIGNFR
jgi:hypothetical protein